MLIADLQKKLDEISEIELMILAILSLYPSYHSKGKLITKMNDFNYKVVTTRQIYAKDIDIPVDNLIRLGLIVQQTGTIYFGINSEIRKNVLWKFKASNLLPLGITFFDANNFRYYNSEELECRLILSLLLNEEQKFFSLGGSSQQITNIIVKLYDNPLLTNQIDDLTASLKVFITKILYTNAINQYLSLKPYINYLESWQDESKTSTLIILYINKGDFAKLSNSNVLQVQAVKHLLQGDNQYAIRLFEQSIDNYRKATGKKNDIPIDITTIFYLLALLQQHDPKSNQTYETFVKAGIKINKDVKSVFSLFEVNKYFKQSNIALAKQYLSNVGDYKEFDWTKFLVWALTKHWHDAFSTVEINFLHTRLKLAVENEYWILAINLFDILSVCKKELADNYKARVASIRTNTGICGFLNLVAHEENWEKVLNSLMLFTDNSKSKKISDKRLVWLVDFEKNDIQPKEQSLDKQGNWTDGRPVALKRLQKNELECMTVQDIKIATHISHSSYGYYGGDSYSFSTEKCFKEMVGHPLLFLYNKPSVGVELVKGQPEIIIEKKGDKYEVSFNEKFVDKGVKIIKETPTRFKIIEITEDLLSIRMSMGKKALMVPERGKEKLQNAIKSLSSFVTIHSDMAEDTSFPTIQANPLTHIHILSFNDGFKIEFFVKPFTTNPPYMKPAVGGKVIYGMIDGKKVQAVRDLHKEEESVLNFINACPSLADFDDYKSSWVFDDPEECLQFLSELEDVKDKVVIEWPEGEKLRIRHRFSFGNLKLNIKSSGTDWFNVSGDLQVGEQQVMEMKTLLSLLEENKTNYIPLGNGDFITLTKEFRRRLEEMSAFADHSKGEFKFNAISAFALNDLFDNLDITADKCWKDTVKNIKTTLKLKPEVPADLDADLRPYQVDGYNWLFRLSHWGVGACLADDMGLGKTVQAIALLLHRAANGASLVVAPASVCGNWVKEILRFAPSLNPVFFNEQRDILMNMNSNSVIICTYGLIQSNIEAFTSITWNAVILDEAQAIKNNATKRWQAVMELNAGFRLITTGTPIQNHLGELWSLFNFINPGLLGSLKAFNERFAVPIEKNQDTTKRHQLKRLIQPFILRRTKNQVLQELPEKTEITINVQLSKEEMAFYEALRQQALEKLESGEGSLEQKRIQILAEITRLRRACCNPSLVAPEIQIESSKLAAFEEVVDELLENKHRALVFSQFIGHLDIIRQLLDKKKITYQYLDGSTPLKEREKSITSFQAGNGDLFLISLKAGGLGLNLTAADYVIHMDPWWNPAIEDQASDRAHRIGQQKPVTIYKLITQRTIEESIIKLHQNKRDLADSLLDGSDISGKVSADELLKLIRN